MITPSFGLTATERVLPKLALDFTTASLDSRVTFTRTTGASNPATYVNSSGVITAATNNQPRFDYDPVTLACKGLLVEESRSNNIKYSQDFGNVIWLQSNATPSIDVETSPDGSANADKIVESNTGPSSHFIYQSQTLLASTNYTISAFFKQAGRSKVRLTFASGTPFGTNPYVNADLSSGTILTTVNGTSTITNYGNNWYRVTLTATTTVGGSSNLSCQLLDDSGNTSYTGDGVKGVYAWGAQLEVGAFATSYIPTTTTALTRNADVAVMTGTNFSDWYNQSEGVFKASAVSNITSGYTGYLTAYGAANIFIAMGRTPTYSWGQVKNTITQANFDNSARTSRIACLAYKANSFAYAAGGTSVLTDTTGTIPTVSELRIGRNDTTGYLNGWISLIEYWPQRLTDAEVQAFSK